MSFVTDHVSRIDGQIDGLQLQRQLSVPSSPDLRSVPDESHQASDASRTSENGFELAQILRIQAAINTLSIASSSRALLHPDTIWATLNQTLEASVINREESGLYFTQVLELQWLLVSKAAVQTYGIILNALLEQTIPLSNEIGYWDKVLGSYRYTGLYTVQTSPIRLWHWANDVYSDAWQRLQNGRSAGEEEGEEAARVPSVYDRWRQFYGLLKDSVRDRSLADMQSKFLSPLTMSRLEARSKRSHLKRLREMSASGLGILMDEGMIFDVDEEAPVSAKGLSNSKEDWRSVVSKSVSLMEMVLQNIHTLELGAGEFEETVFMSVDDDSQPPQHDNMQEQSVPRGVQLASRLQEILRVHIPMHITTSSDLAKEYGRPSRVKRYWLPGLALFLSSGTLFHILVNRKAEIITWIRDFGTTSIDFWNNWVVEPMKKVIRTIRHDKDSEIAIMSRESLKGDRDSLERMVIDFARDNPNTSTGLPLTESEISVIRTKIREGDLTPVLRAYEKDLRKPFMGTIRGDLVRALLIQIQKTKVDVELAVSGIDALLKSQELVFGFVGNIDRILSGATPSESGMLSYKDHGMLLCEVHILRQKAQGGLPGEIYNEFLEEVNDLVDLRTGVERQTRVVERIRWTYSKQLS
ncbi:MAG: Nuclear control of ATPase protein 2 [Alectoria fallacina]|uniref:Nuclear control of ATPase protein 2 n=1 Tax=Alectoria fallacina TaxID=1903189 RepID=A0A8H3J355_9LECA|nr:MAG: Nuclear control of ATPase protein 2 [Alectoria fallacina]